MMKSTTTNALRTMAILLASIFAGTSLQAQNAQVQVIHNSGDFTMEAVDVYVGDSLVADSLFYRTATSYMDIPSGGNAVFTLQDPSMPDTNAALYSQTVNLNADSSYVAVINGLISGAPYDSVKPLRLEVASSRTESRTSGDTEILFYHGAVDVGPLNIEETTVPIPNMVEGLRYGEFTEYEAFSVADYEYTASQGTVGQEVIAEYQAPLQSYGWGDSAVVILSSGFRDTLKTEEGDTNFLHAPKFRLFAAMPSGGALIPLPILSDIGLEEHASEKMEIYPVPAGDRLFIRGDRELELEEALIYTNTGKLMRYSGLEGEPDSTYEIDLTGLDSGFYLIRLKGSEGYVHTRKIFVK